MAASSADNVAGIAASLSSLADEHGSDKGFGAGLRHGYKRVYASALSSDRDKPLKLLEIGLSIARDGVYFPSLAMCSNRLPGAEIYGLDIHDF